MRNENPTGKESVGMTEVEQDETIEISKEGFIRLFDSFNLFAEVIVEVRNDGVALPDKDTESLEKIEEQIDFAFSEDTFLGSEFHEDYIRLYKEWAEQVGDDE